ncbi:neutral/alkaline non-lysosomal ceramidase N-terminal domain-containing protein [Acidobacteriota bacterium]
MDLKIGVGKHDITGPCAELGFMGYWDFGQTGKGIHSRQFSRAYVIEDLSNGKSVAIVCADMGVCTQAIQQAVVKKLKDHFGDLYMEKNVLISATHTHSAPGGCSHYFLYNASMLGFDEQNLNAVAEGIYSSIVFAHENKRGGKILIAKGDVEDCGNLRSVPAYENNPADERAPYTIPEFKEMTLLKFVDENEQAIGSMNWFAVHTTSMGQQNRQISGDNKGYAEELFEKDKGAISAFGNSCCGDVSPNMKYGVPDGIHDFERTVEFGNRQYQKAVDLFDSAVEELNGNVDYRQTFVDMDCCVIEGTDKRTWPAAMGLGMTPGSSEDSEGMPIWPEGTTRESVEHDPDLVKQALARILPVVFGIVWPQTLEDEYIEGHGQKPILIACGLTKIKGVPLVPSVMPVQLIRIGNLVLIAHPGEMTTMAGRRMRKTVLDILGDGGVDYVVVVNYAGAYSSYTTTKEEYDMQYYEGASTLYGPWTLEAYQQENAKLAEALKNNQDVPPGPEPPDVSDRTIDLRPGVWCDDAPVDREFGDVIDQPNSTYAKGQKVVVSFQGAHPNNNLRTESTYFSVEKLGAAGWEIVYSDKDFCTKMKWKRHGLPLLTPESIVTIEWEIPQDQESGQYRIKYFGDWKSLTNDIEPFIGESREFTVL